MPRINVSTFNESLEKSLSWIEEIMQESGMESPESAYSALRAVLHALRDRLPIGEATDLAAEMPMLIRGLYYEGWNPNQKPEKMSEEDFMFRVHQHYRFDPEIHPESIVGVILKVLERRISEGELSDIKANLPKDLQQTWSSVVG